MRSYNDVAGTLGRPLAGAHGGWVQPEDKAASSVGNSRYDRFPLSLVIRIAACIAGMDLGDLVLGAPSEEPGSARVPAGEIRERAAAKPVSMQRKAPLRVSAAEVNDLATAEGSESEDEEGPVDRTSSLPPGWTKSRRTRASGRAYWRFAGPEGSGSRVMFSLTAVWGEFDSCLEMADEVVPDLDDFEGEPEGRDIDDEGPAHGLRGGRDGRADDVGSCCFGGRRRLWRCR